MFAIIISFAKTKLECAPQPCPPSVSLLPPAPPSLLPSCAAAVPPVLSPPRCHPHAVIPTLSPLCCHPCCEQLSAPTRKPPARSCRHLGGEGVPREPPGPQALRPAHGDAGRCQEPPQEVSRAAPCQVWPRSGVGVSMGRGRDGSGRCHPHCSVWDLSLSAPAELAVSAWHLWSLAAGQSDAPALPGPAQIPGFTGENANCRSLSPDHPPERRRRTSTVGNPAAELSRGWAAGGGFFHAVAVPAWTARALLMRLPGLFFLSRRTFAISRGCPVCW